MRSLSGPILPTLAALFAATLALGGCGDTGVPKGDATEALGTGQVEKASPGAALTITDARLALPAVGGRPGGAYFTLRNAGSRPATITAVRIEGAERTEMHETRGGTMASLRSVEVRPGEAASFAPGGRHVMVFGLVPTLVAGGRTKLTLSFADGTGVSAPIEVRAAGDGGAQAMTMDMPMDAH